MVECRTSFSRPSMRDSTIDTSCKWNMHGPGQGQVVRMNCFLAWLIFCHQIMHGLHSAASIQPQCCCAHIYYLMVATCI
jgi:hypothetical protein